ncbi:MAG: hypothetical protein AB1592_14285 [Pseudomonadota bacterium]
MIVTAKTEGEAGLAARLERALGPRLVEAALERAEAALTAEAARAGVVLEQEGAGTRRRLGTSDPAAVARETGTLATPADPWLIPALAGLRRRP